MPWYYNTKTDALVVNPKHKLKLIPRMIKMPIWTLYNTTAILGFFISTSQLFLGLFSNNNENEQNHNQEISLHCVIFVVTLLVLVTSYSVNESQINFCNNLFHVKGIQYVGFPTTERLPAVTELMGYGLIFMFFCFPVVAAVSPFLIDTKMFDNFLTLIIPENYQRSFVAIFFGTFGYTASIVLGNFLIFQVACCHVFEKLAEQNLLLSKGIPSENRLNSTEKVLLLLSKYFLTVLEYIYPKWKSFGWKVRKCSQNRISAFNFTVMRHNHNTLLFFTNISNENMRVFLPTLAGVGIALCVVSNCVAILLFDRSEFIVKMIWFSALGILICIYFLVMTLCHHASMPLVYSQECIAFWRGELKSLLGRKQVRAMKPYGFTMGPIFVVKKRTALDIMDAIFNYSVTFLLAI